MIGQIIYTMQCNQPMSAQKKINQKYPFVDMAKNSQKYNSQNLTRFYYDENQKSYDKYDDDNYGYLYAMDYQERINNQFDEDDLCEEEREYLKYVLKTQKNNLSNKTKDKNLKFSQAKTRSIIKSKSGVSNLDYVVFSYIFSFLQPLDITRFINSTTFFKNQFFDIAWRVLCLRDFPFIMKEQEEYGFMNEDFSSYELYKKYFMGRKKNIFDLTFAIISDKLKRKRFEELLSCVVLFKSYEIPNPNNEERTIKIVTIFVSHTIKDNTIKIWELRPRFKSIIRKEHNLGYYEDVKLIKSLYNEEFIIVMTTNTQNQKDTLYIFNVPKPIDYTLEKRLSYEKKLIINYQRQDRSTPIVNILNDDPLNKSLEIEILYEYMGKINHFEFDESDSILYLTYNYYETYFLLSIDLAFDGILKTIKIQGEVRDIRLLRNDIPNKQSNDIIKPEEDEKTFEEEENEKSIEEDEKMIESAKDEKIIEEKVQKHHFKEELIGYNLLIVCKSQLIIIDKDRIIIDSHLLPWDLSNIKFCNLNEQQFKNFYIINDDKGKLLAFDSVTNEIRIFNKRSIIHSIRLKNSSLSQFEKNLNNINSQISSMATDNNIIEFIYSPESNLKEIYYHSLSLKQFQTMQLDYATNIEKSKKIYTFPTGNIVFKYHFYEFNPERYLIIELNKKPRNIMLLNIYTSDIISKSIDNPDEADNWNIIYDTKKILLYSTSKLNFCERKVYFIDLEDFYTLKLWSLFHIIELGYYKDKIPPIYDDQINEKKNTNLVKIPRRKLFWSNKLISRNQLHLFNLRGVGLKQLF